MAWSDAARAAALEARRQHGKKPTPDRDRSRHALRVMHGLTQQARGNALGPNDDLLSSLRDQLFRTKVAAINATKFNTPKQWGSRPGWAMRQIIMGRAEQDAKFLHNKMSKLYRRYARKIGK